MRSQFDFETNFSLDFICNKYDVNTMTYILHSLAEYRNNHKFFEFIFVSARSLVLKSI